MKKQTHQSDRARYQLLFDMARTGRLSVDEMGELLALGHLLIISLEKMSEAMLADITPIVLAHMKQDAAGGVNAVNSLTQRVRIGEIEPDADATAPDTPWVH